MLSFTYITSPHCRQLSKTSLIRTCVHNGNHLTTTSFNIMLDKIVVLNNWKVQIEDDAHFSALSSGRSNIRLIENELLGPQLGRLT